ncbi:MAG TPA: hypothetical protein VE441_15520 [Mycobacterium sp.]|nr:hypothetical protein [Mycobacterium sp.]
MRSIRVSLARVGSTESKAGPVGALGCGHRVPIGSKSHSEVEQSSAGLVGLVDDVRVGEVEQVPRQCGDLCGRSAVFVGLVEDVASRQLRLGVARASRCPICW